MSKPNKSWLPNSPRDRRVLAIAILLLVVVVVVAAIAVPVYLLNRHYDENLAKMTRQWKSQTAFNELRPQVTRALEQLLDEAFAVAAKNRLDECWDRRDAHRGARFTPLAARWKDRFGTTDERLLYALTSTYFEGQMSEAPKAVHG